MTEQLAQVVKDGQQITKLQAEIARLRAALYDIRRVAYVISDHDFGISRTHVVHTIDNALEDV